MHSTNFSPWYFGEFQFPTWQSDRIAISVSSFRNDPKVGIVEQPPAPKSVTDAAAHPFRNSLLLVSMSCTSLSIRVKLVVDSLDIKREKPRHLAAQLGFKRRRAAGELHRESKGARYCVCIRH